MADDDSSTESLHEDLPEKENAKNLEKAEIHHHHHLDSTESDEGAPVYYRRDAKRMSVYFYRLWIQDRTSHSFIVRVCTGFYALFLVILGVVIELSSLIVAGHNRAATGKDLFMAVFMYGGSMLFLFYFCFSLIKREALVRRERRSLHSEGIFAYKAHEHQTTISTGSMYLRIGCVAFGMIGVVYYILIFLVCTLGWEGKERDCNSMNQVIALLASSFIFAQMWFVFCNGKVAVRGYESVARWGLMHLVATNLWMWICYILYEEAQTVAELGHAHFKTALDDELAKHEVFRTTSSHHDDSLFTVACLGVHCVLGQASELMYTCVVEYSLMGAGVAFVFWTSVGEAIQKEEQRKKKNRSIISMDCSRTYVGLFSGFGFLVITIISVILFNAYAHEKELSQWIFLSSNVVIFVLAIGICIAGFWRMRVLRFKVNTEEEPEEKSAEFLDQLLLVVGLIGELVYCMGGILAFVNNDDRQPLSYLLFLVHICRLFQVIIQSGLIFISNRLVLNSHSPHILQYKPGKQIITLLVIINISQFLLNVFEASKAGITEEVVRLYGHRSWALLVRGCSPLTIFYRFHASSCFAEIWKKTFKVGLLEDDVNNDGGRTHLVLHGRPYFFPGLPFFDFFYCTFGGFNAIRAFNYT